MIQGCNRACAFCATGQMGFLRNLSADEILAQVYHARRAARLGNMVSTTLLSYANNCIFDEHEKRCSLQIVHKSSVAVTGAVCKQCGMCLYSMSTMMLCVYMHV